MDVRPTGNATGPEFCKGEALGRGSLFGWPTPCVLEATSSVLHGVFVLFVFQFALSLLHPREVTLRRSAAVPRAAADARYSYYASDALRLGLSLAAVINWLGSILVTGIAKGRLPPDHTLLMITSATSWTCYLALSVELDAIQATVLPSVRPSAFPAAPPLSHLPSG